VSICTSFLPSRFSRSVSSALSSRFPSSADAVESYSRCVSKVARYRWERMPMECERSAQEVTFRLPLASSFLPHCHAVCGGPRYLSASSRSMKAFLNCTNNRSRSRS
jgi:hypothetical protein